MWKNKNVWILLSGEFIAGLGLWLGIIGNLEFMQEKVHSDFLKSIIIAVGLLAGVAMGPLAGKVTDQSRKKTVMLAAGFVRTISVVFMLIAIQTGSIWWMVIFLICIQVSAAFYFPALQAAIPLVVEEKDLLQLNGISMNVSTISRILGTAIAGISLVIMSLSALYIASLAAYLTLFIFTMFLNIDEKKTDKNNPKSKEAAHTGFNEIFPVIKELPIVFMTLILTMSPLLFLGGFNLMVINISELQGNSSIKGLIYAAEGFGFMLGAFLAKQINLRNSPYTILFACSLIVGLSQLLLYFAYIPLVSVLAFLIFGMAVGCFFPTAATIFQTRVPKEFHGRFFSFRNMFDRVIFQIVLLMTGFLLDTIGLQYMTVAFGTLSIMMTIFFIMNARKAQTQSMMNEKIS